MRKCLTGGWDGHLTSQLECSAHGSRMPTDEEDKGVTYTTEAGQKTQMDASILQHVRFLRLLY